MSPSAGSPLAGSSLGVTPLGVRRQILEAIAAQVGTPTYVYDAAQLQADADRWFQAAGQGAVFYSVKANGNLAILSRLAEWGLSAEVATEGELGRALEAEIPPERIVFGGVPKSDVAIRRALEAGLDLVVLQADREVDAALRHANHDRPAAVGLRVRPGIVAGAHPSLETGRKDAKFGLAPDDVPGAWARLAASPGLSPTTLAVHLGSGLDSLEPYSRALDTLLELCDALAGSGQPVQGLDLGGGIGIDYADGSGPQPEALAAFVRERLAGTNLHVRYEPGRSVVARSGVLLMRVLYEQRNGGRPAVVCDAGFTDFSRFMLYGAEHRIEPLEGSADGPPTVDVLGPTCETGDVLGTARALHGVEAGDLLLLRDVGAYGFTMASNYNSRPRPAEVLVEGESWSVIRPRESLADLWRGEAAGG
ncbi:MAG: diaminopimelate decarboxylase [Gemmatimonadota bacterium]